MERILGSFFLHITNNSFGSTLGMKNSVGPRRENLIGSTPSKIPFLIIEHRISGRNIASKTRFQAEILHLQLI